MATHGYDQRHRMKVRCTWVGRKHTRSCRNVVGPKQWRIIEVLPFTPPPKKPPGVTPGDEIAATQYAESASKIKDFNFVHMPGQFRTVAAAGDWPTRTKWAGCTPSAWHSSSSSIVVGPTVIAECYGGLNLYVL